MNDDNDPENIMIVEVVPAAAPGTARIRVDTGLGMQDFLGVYDSVPALAKVIATRLAQWAADKVSITIHDDLAPWGDELKAVLEKQGITLV